VTGVAFGLSESTDSNPSDGLSREGLQDAWTQRQCWSLAHGVLPDFSDLQEALLRFTSRTFSVNAALDYSALG
jgi:hypothetical protein